MQAGVTSSCFAFLVMMSIATQTGCLQLQDILQNKLVPEVSLTEIWRIMPEEGELNATNGYTQVIVEDAGDIEEGLIWDIILTSLNSEGQTILETTDSVKNGDKFTITFREPFIDVKSLILVGRNGIDTADYKAIWNDGVTLIDTKARVAVVGDDATGNAFLRVTTGEVVGAVNVVTDKTCQPENSPCYYQRKDLPTKLPIIERCYTNTTVNHKTTIKYCDVTVSEFRVLPDPPAILLLDNTKLNLMYNSTASFVEVLLVNSTTGEQLNSYFNCIIHSDTECSLDIIETIDTVDIMVVMFDENGYVVGSDTYPFENYGVSWLGLSSDVLMASWASSEKSDFLVKLLVDSTSVFQSVLTCGGDGTADALGCEVFFADPKVAPVNAITVQKLNDFNSVGKTGVPGGDTPQSSITTITTIGDDKENIIFEVTTVNGIPSSATIVEIISDPGSETISNNKYTGQVSQLSPQSYSVECSLTNSTYEGEKKFILISYNETFPNRIQEVGTVYATLTALNINVHRVGNPNVGVSALWLTKPNGDSFSMDDVTCEADKPTCYLLDFPTTRETVAVCTKIPNDAVGEDLSQCVIKTPEVPDDMSLSKFQLKDRKDIVVTAPFVSNDVHIILYHASLKIEKNCVPTGPPRVENKICTVDSGLPGEGQATLLKALLVGTNTEGAVIDSTAVEVEDLQFQHSRFFDDTLTVNWTALNPEGYTTTLQELSALKAISLKDNREVVPSNIECSESSCVAFYHDLNPTASYTLSVHKIGEPISETSEVIEMNTITVNDNPEMKIVNVKKIGATKTEINLATEVNIAYYVYVLVEMPGIQFLSLADIISKTIISFNHDIPIFDGAKTTSFIMFCFDTNKKFAMKGRAYLDLQDLDSKLAWVAPPPEDQRKSLRVDAGSQEVVDMGERKCLKKDSPCYFIEDSLLPNSVERCVQVNNTADNTFVEQCDTEITSFQEMKGVAVSLSGNNVEVSLTLENANDILEVKIYDPTNGSAIFSVGNVTCDPASNGSSTACVQPLRTPSDGRPARVLVVEMDADGVVLKSAVKDISFPATGVESWVIAVSVLASVLGAALIVYAIVVFFKKNKSRKAVRKELQVISGDEPHYDRSRSIALDELDDSDRFSRVEQNPYKPKHPAPPVPRKPFRKDSMPPMGPYSNPYGPGHDNQAFTRGERFGDAPVGLPRIQPRIQAGPGRPGYY